MNPCEPIKCPECVPLFRYFVNQQPALLNSEQTITPECPVGYTCDPVDPFVVPEGEKKVIPDVDPNDPDINPDCDYDCEVNNVFDNPNTLLNPRILVRSDEVTATCADVGLDPNGSAMVTLPAGLLMRNLGVGEFAIVVKAELNVIAMDLAKQKLLQDIADGVQSCFDFSAPLAVWEYGLSEIVGLIDYTVADAAQYYLLGPIAHGEIQFRSADVCERVYFTADPGIYQEWYRMPGLSSGAYSRIAHQFGADPITGFLNFTGTPNRSFVSCAATVLAQLAFAQPSMPGFDSGYDPSEKVFYLDKRAAAWTHPDWTHEGACNVTFTRLSKPIFDPYDYLKQIVIDDSGSLTAVFKGSYWDDDTQPEWDRVMNFHEYYRTVLNWRSTNPLNISQPPLFNIGTKRLSTLNRIRWFGSVNRTQFGAPAGPDVAVWALQVSLVTSFVTRPWLQFIKLGGSGPEGSYSEMPDIVVSVSFSDIPITYQGTLNTATNDPLPASTLLAGVITADVNGILPDIGGVTLSNGEKVLVKDEINAERNGPYVVTDVGSAGTPWILTRDASFNTNLHIQVRGGFLWKVTDGDNPGFWQLMNEGAAINTDPVAFAPYVLKTINVSYLP